MASPQVSISQQIQKMAINQSDKRLLLAAFSGLTDDIEQLRASLNAALAKLDAAAAGTVANLGTNNVATLAVAKAALNVKKS
jgi:hypothetical protein